METSLPHATRRPPPLLRVVVVERDATFGSAVPAQLYHGVGVVVVGTASTSADAERSVRTLQPDVVILSVHLPDEDGLPVLRRMHAAAPRAAIMLQGELPYGVDPKGLWSLGVREVIEKRTLDRELAFELRRAAAADGETVGRGIAQPASTSTAGTIRVMVGADRPLVWCSASRLC
jgi:DNA-binding NarL/FixJ family response regulator